MGGAPAATFIATTGHLLVSTYMCIGVHQHIQEEEVVHTQNIHTNLWHTLYALYSRSFTNPQNSF